MSAPRYVAALDALALTLAAALGLGRVARDMTFAQDAADGADLGEGARLMAALPDGQSAVVDRLLGGTARPYTVTHTTRLLIAAHGGPAEDRRLAVHNAMAVAAGAIEADPTIGGRVADCALNGGDWQEVAEDAGVGLVGDVLELELLIESETPLG